MNMHFQLRTVDKYHGQEKNEPVIELDPAIFASLKAAGAGLRAAKLLCTGQRVREIRRIADGVIIVFPHNAPGLTTGVHSYRFTPINGTGQAGGS